MTKTRQALLGAVSIAIGLLLAVAILAAAEWAVRAFTDISFGGNSKNLFTPNRFGPSMGNTPNVQAQAFGMPVYIDSNGFRVPAPDYRYPANPSGTLLLIGDSLTFGVGVEERATFAGRLRTSNPGWSVYNAAVIGYSTADYLNTVRTLLDRGHVFSKAVLVFCLNDVSRTSAAEIDRAVHLPPDGNQPKAANHPESPARRPPADGDFVERLKGLDMLVLANAFLRERSKLYLLIKGLITDPSRRYFAADLQGYLDKKALWQDLAPLETIAAELASRNIDFLVVIAPYEYQLRPGSEGLIEGRDVRLPQRLISEFLAQRNITHVDATGAFTTGTREGGAKYFLSFDPMHFSPAGHEVMFSLVRDRVSKETD